MYTANAPLRLGKALGDAEQDDAGDDGNDAGMDIHVFHPKKYVKAVVASGLDVFVWMIDDLGNCEKFISSA